MINIAVCIKQVPISKSDIDDKTNNMKRNDNNICMNMYDYFSLEMALQIKEHFGGKVTAFSMGRESAKDILREAIALGVDDAILISDAKLRGSDALATAYTLSKSISSSHDYDVIICGKQSTDGDTAQVGGEIAGIMDIPYISGVTKVIDIKNDTIQVISKLDNKMLSIEATFPILISTIPNNIPIRTPTLKNRMKATRANILVYDCEYIKADINRIGENGSPTKVVTLRKKDMKRKKDIKSMSIDECFNIIDNEIKKIKDI